MENIIICHRDTNEEKANSFPHWKANGTRYVAIRVRGTRNEYEIYEILKSALYEFPVLNIDIKLPEWVHILSNNHKVKEEYLSKIKTSTL